MPVRERRGAGVGVPWRELATALVGFATYLGLARLSLAWLLEGDEVQPFWPATAATAGLAIALPAPLRRWVVAGGMAGQVVSSVVLFHDGAWNVLVALAANLAEVAIVVPAIIRLLARQHGRILVRKGVAWLGIVAVGAAVSGVIAGAGTTGLDDRLDFGLRWILGDFVALVVVTPLCLLRLVRVIVPMGRWQVVELVAAVAVLVGATVAAFATPVPLEYLTVPLLVWLAVRFGPLVGLPAVLGVVLYATIRTAHGSGAFAITDRDPVLQVQAFNLAVGVSVLLSVFHAVRAADERTRLHDEVQERRRLEVALEHLRVEEQERLAHHLHDMAVQVLVAADLRLGIAAHAAPPEVRDELEPVGDMVRAAISELRLSIDDLTTVTGDADDVVDGIEQVVTRWRDVAGTEIRCDLDPVPMVDPSLARVVYQVAREAIANAVLHSQGGRVDIRLRRGPGGLVVEVSDDGVGPGLAVDPRGRDGHLGVRLMHERTSAVGGVLQVLPRVPRGTTVRASVPLAAPR